ncbi:MAG: AAA family ATPase [Lachnospiraceae bacterium]|nr:AAA family ATPase [Lachnospiraceae bacterium]
MGNFDLEIKEMAKVLETTSKECVSMLKKMYDGYHFSENSKGIYNPFSLINALADKKFDSYMVFNRYADLPDPKIERRKL